MPHPDSEMNAIPAQPTGDGHHGHDPNQPRVPAGHSDGGQWTRTPGSGTPAAPRRTAVVDRSGEEAWGSYVDTYRSDGTLAEERVFNRDGSRIVSEFNEPGSPGGWDERYTVVLRDGSKVVFQNSGDVHAIFDGEGRPISAAVWTEHGPEQLPVGQLAFVGPAVVGVEALAESLAPAGVAAAALALYAWFSSRSDRRRSPVFAFKAGDYGRVETKDKQPEVTMVGLLTRDEVEKACEKLVDVQERTDAAVKMVRDDNKYKGPADFGTRVHKLIADGINHKGGENYKAEQSGFKSKQADAKRGQKGSIRIDAYENRPEHSLVCIYDPKTGERGLSFPRMLELAQTAQTIFRKAKPGRFIVIEVRPGQQ